MTFADAAPVMGPVRGGTARALAVSSPQRHPAMPEVPTFAEAGLTDMEIVSWTALFAPAGTAPAVIARLQSEVARVVRLPEIRDGLGKLGVDPVGSGGEELGRVMRRDIERWSAVAKTAGIKND